jgi:hypothetical protein
MMGTGMAAESATPPFFLWRGLAANSPLPQLKNDIKADCPNFFFFEKRKMMNKQYRCDKLYSPIFRP